MCARVHDSIAKLQSAIAAWMCICVCRIILVSVVCTCTYVGSVDSIWNIQDANQRECQTGIFVCTCGYIINFHVRLPFYLSFDLYIVDPQASVVDGASGEDQSDVGYVEYQERKQEQGVEHEAEIKPVSQHKKRRITWQDLRERMVQGVTIMWSFLLYTSYVPAIICMMVSLWTYLHMWFTFMYK